MIEILMATYNGENHLKEQLDSIMAQDYTDFTVTVRDDGSTDGTLKIIRRFITKYPGKIRLFEDADTQYNSAKSNFTQLIANAQPDCYYCLCCQDDIWKPDKLTKQFTKMKQMEALSGIRTPILVHSDMKIVNVNRNVLHKSYVRYANIKPNEFTLKRMLVENCVVGLTCMFNSALMMLVKNIPENAVSHEWWIGLYAVAIGKVAYIKEPLVEYRQHARNTVGAISGRGIDIIRNFKNISRNRFDTQKSYYQAAEFQKSAQKLLNSDKLKIISSYSALAYSKKIKKVIYVLCLGYTKHSIVGSVAQAINS